MANKDNMRTPGASALKNGWRDLWGGRTPRPSLIIIASLSAILMAVPLIYILYRGADVDPAAWISLWNGRLPVLFLNTVTITFFVTALTIAIGISLAWLVERTDLPGRKAWRWVLAMPLAIPPYVGAIVYIAILGPRGIVEDHVERIFGASVAESLPQLFGFTGAATVLVLFTYPYIYLLVSAALRSFNLSFEEAGQALGYTGFELFRRVTLPLIKPAIGAGALLVALYVLSDFGAVTMMRFNTFTSAIYVELTTRFSRERAAMLSLVLVVLTLLVLMIESKIRGKARYYQTTGTWRPFRVHELGKYRYIALGYVLLIFTLCLGLPLFLLGYWTYLSMAAGGVAGSIESYALNSFMASAAAATLAMVIAAPIAYLVVRHAGALSLNLYRLAQTGYALPGVVVALSIIFLFINFFPALYGTLIVLLTAYVVRFLPQSLQGTQSALNQVSPNLEEASRSLGRNYRRTFQEVTIPLILPGLIAGWALVFLSALKELPATLLLRPIGFDTLPINLWMEASEGFYTLAAPSALILVIVSAVPLYILLNRARAGFSGIQS